MSFENGAARMGEISPLRSAPVEMTKKKLQKCSPNMFSFSFVGAPAVIARGPF